MSLCSMGVITHALTHVILMSYQENKSQYIDYWFSAYAHNIQSLSVATCTLRTSEDLQQVKWMQINYLYQNKVLIANILKSAILHISTYINRQCYITIVWQTYNTNICMHRYSTAMHSSNVDAGNLLLTDMSTWGSPLTGHHIT